MQKDTATVAEVLKLNAWSTAWFGKNHNVPDWQTSQAGPFDLWPTGLGFEHFFGFIGGDTHQWRPAAIEGTKPVEPYLDNPDYHFDDDLADRAVKWIRTQQAVAPEKPFFLYYAPGATHAPHHPRKEWVKKYAGTFDAGWDVIREETLARQKALGIVPADTKLVPLAPGIPAWASLTADQKKVYARMMEVYAGFLEQTDHNAGRVIDAIEQAGELDNTLVLFIVGDNGASAEGSAQGLLNEMTFFNGVKEDPAKVLARVDDIGSWQTYNHYPIGWAHAMCTPFQWTKQIASHYGGTRNGLVVSWPKGIADHGGVRTQWHHVIDIVPTIYEACGVTPPEVVNGVTQKSIDGISMAYSFAEAAAPSRRTTQYFEMIGNRAIYHDGWVACTTPPVPPWDPAAAEVDAIDGYQWGDRIYFAFAAEGSKGLAPDALAVTLVHEVNHVLNRSECSYYADVWAHKVDDTLAFLEEYRAFIAECVHRRGAGATVARCDAWANAQLTERDYGFSPDLVALLGEGATDTRPIAQALFADDGQFGWLTPRAERWPEDFAACEPAAAIR
jgi:arylsulfatase